MTSTVFRGKKCSNGEWIKGSFILMGYLGDDTMAYHIVTGTKDNNGNIIVSEINIEDIIPDTLGQFTGKLLGGEELFDGDIVEWYEDYDDSWSHPATAVGRSVVVWDEENFCWAFETDGTYKQAFNDWPWDTCHIIGNVYDNPELIRKEDTNA